MVTRAMILARPTRIPKASEPMYIDSTMFRTIAMALSSVR